MAKINPQAISGRWQSGVALDVHTIGSIYLGVNEAGHEIYDTTRSELGELLYRLKYREDPSVVPEIVAAATGFLRQHREKFDVIVPVPPSGIRVVQPVAVLATALGKAMGVPVSECVTLTRPATALKGVLDPARRRELLDGLHAVDPAKMKNREILLFDDLFRSGATMNAVTDLLQKNGAASVRALTITRTRSNH